MTRRPAPEVRAQGVFAWYGDVPVLRDVTLTCPAGQITGIIGPAGAGKSTFLRIVNRLAEESDDFRRAGRLFLDDEDVLAQADPTTLRQRVGWLSDRPALFRGTVYDNVAFGPRIAGFPPREVARRVEESLREAGLFAALERRLQLPASDLALVDQQRLCLARALALDPEVLLLDEPTRRLDALATNGLEEVLLGFRGERTVVLVTHDTQQAGRVADVTAFFDRGTLVEAGATEDLFTHPRDPATEAYLSRRYA